MFQMNKNMHELKSHKLTFIVHIFISARLHAMITHKKVINLLSILNCMIVIIDYDPNTYSRWVVRV